MENTKPNRKPAFYSFMYRIKVPWDCSIGECKGLEMRDITELTACCSLVMQDQLLKNRSDKSHIYFLSVTEVGHSNRCR